MIGVDVCPPVEDQPKNCRTCCCKSSNNVEFYHPEDPSHTECGASENAMYKVSLIPTISTSCHPRYPFENGSNAAYFSDILIGSHGPARLIDTCVRDYSDNVLNYLLNTEEVLGSSENIFAEGFEDMYLSPEALERVRRRRRSALIEVSSTKSHITLISKLVCTNRRSMRNVAMHYSFSSNY